MNNPDLDEISFSILNEVAKRKAMAQMPTMDDLREQGVVININMDGAVKPRPSMIHFDQYIPPPRKGEEIMAFICHSGEDGCGKQFKTLPELEQHFKQEHMPQ